MLWLGDVLMANLGPEALWLRESEVARLIRSVVAQVARVPHDARGPNVCFMVSMAFWRIGAMRMEMTKVPMMGRRSCFSN